MIQTAITLKSIQRFVVLIVLVRFFTSEGFAQDADNPAVTEGAAVSEAFRSRDKDSDGKISEEEFLAAGGQEPTALKRDFRVFDANEDGRLSEPEFHSIPAFTTEAQRVAIQDPIAALSKRRLEELSDLWPDLDADKDGQLTVDEFKGEAVDAALQDAGGFQSWDRNGDGKVSLEEAASLIDMSFGVRSRTDELLRTPSGFVVDWRMFRGMNPDETGAVGRDDYIKAMGSQEAAEKWFAGINKSERFNVTEFLTSGHKTDPVNTFLSLDTDLNGQVSRAELDGLPSGWAPAGMSWLAGFDDDGNGEYSLPEFMLLPHVNLLATWHTAQDLDNNGVLSLDEFLPMPRPSLTALATEYFRRLDVNNDMTLNLKEWRFNTSNPHARFLAMDKNDDQSLSKDEFTAESGLQSDQFSRDFSVFDADSDGKMTKSEFLTIPYWVPESDRTPIHDPLVALSQSRFSQIKDQWSQWDKNKDGVLQESEFQSATIAKSIEGLATSPFADWDLDHGGSLSQEEAALIIDVSFGVRAASGEALRTNSGYVPDWRGFRGLDPDGDGRVPRDEYLSRMSAVANPEEWYLRISKDDAASFGRKEFLLGPYHTDPVGMFLGMDTDLNARLTPDEINAIPADWGPANKTWLPGFDDDGDGGYSLREFMLIPHVNLLATWMSAQDKDQDGKLSLEEFRFVPTPELSALCAVYFHRLDVNKDQSLSLIEWPFQTSHPEARFLALDTNGDGNLSESEFVAEASLPADRLRRDFKVFDADNDGQMILPEFLAIPHWVPLQNQTPILDPVVQLSKLSLSHWVEWDKDGDDLLSVDEFQAALPGQKIHGLEFSTYADWDMDGNGNVSHKDASVFLDVAFGIRETTGELLRSQGGKVVDWGFFHSLDPDGDGRVTREEYLRHMQAIPDAQSWYVSIAKDGLDSFGIAEFVVSDHRTDPVSVFLAIDTDLDARLSPEELKSVPWGPPVKHWLSGFDDDADGVYSLHEFLLIPYINLIGTWHGMTDTNQDGKLTLDEFHVANAPVFAALSAEYFKRLDVNRDGALSLLEWPFHTSHPDARFAAIDVDSDGELTESEFVAEGSLPPDRLKRDFKVFDVDGNGSMTHSEFFTIPYWVPEGQRLGIPDPVVELSATRLVELKKLWTNWDTDGDGSLSREEFKAASPGRQIHGLEMSGFGDWDWDKDQKVSKEDAAHVLDMAYGVQSPTGELLRSKTGNIIDWRTFLGLKPDSTGKVHSSTYITQLGSLEKAMEWFPAIKDLKDGSFGVTEFTTSNHRVDPLSTFLGLDVDLNGLLSPAELESLPAWGPPGRNWLPGFDDDRDGSYSLTEFRLVPQVNLLASWESARDFDNDGKLSSHEFHFMPTPSLGCLAKEYFRRLDSNSDGFLTLKEWPFLFDPAKVPTSVLIEQRDRDGDGKLSFEETNGNLKRTQPGDQVDVGQEAGLARAEEAFRLADANNDGVLDQQELSANEGLEVIAPGSTSLSKTVVSDVAAPVSRLFNMEEDSLGTYLIIEANILLVVGVAIYLYRKRGEKK